MYEATLRCEIAAAPDAQAHTVYSCVLCTFVNRLVIWNRNVGESFYIKIQLLKNKKRLTG
jgi:hypothetical protein